MIISYRDYNWAYGVFACISRKSLFSFGLFGRSCQRAYVIIFPLQISSPSVDNPRGHETVSWRLETTHKYLCPLQKFNRSKVTVTHILKLAFMFCMFISLATIPFSLCISAPYSSILKLGNCDLYHEVDSHVFYISVNSKYTFRSSNFTY